MTKPVDAPNSRKLRTLRLVDYILGIGLLAVCFAFFLHVDIYNEGWCSLNYLYGNPLDFYDNCRKQLGIGIASYLPSTYIVFALCLYPFKALGTITDPTTFPLFLAFWLKVVTTALYGFSGLVFYRIARMYSSNGNWATYAAVAWLTMPIALFSQFIFSQYDIFHTLFSLLGVLFFLRKRPYWASAAFSVAITFKYFPTFTFLPLLLLHEKRLTHIASCIGIFCAPSTLYRILYSHSPGFIDEVVHLPHVERAYAAYVGLDIYGYLRLYLLPAAFLILCTFAFFSEPTEKTRLRLSAYLWLCGSVLPFTFIFWHPQWLMAVAPAITLSSILLSRQTEKYFLFDLLGMFLYVATVVIIFQNNVDAAMFRGQWAGLDTHNSFLMAWLFALFGDHSTNIYLTGFTTYLLLQPILKRELIRESPAQYGLDDISYSTIRQRFYLGLVIFLVPASFAICKDLIDDGRFIDNEASGNRYEIVMNHTYEQTFVPVGARLTYVALSLERAGRTDYERDDMTVQIVDNMGVVIGKSTAQVFPSQERFCWQMFNLNVPVKAGSLYRIRLTSAVGEPGHAFAINASFDDSYKLGEAYVDGVATRQDWAFRVFFRNR